MDESLGTGTPRGGAEVNAFAAAITSALSHAGVGLTELRDRLTAKGHPISLTTLSYWRSGQRLPERPSSLEALAAVEAILGLAPGALARLVPGSAARRIGHVERFDRIMAPPVIEPKDETTFLGESDVSRVSTQVTIDVGRHRQVDKYTVRRLFVANRDGADGVTVFLGTDEESGAEAVQFRAIAGCTIEEMVQPAKKVRRVRLLFPRPLRLGESALTEVEITHSDEYDLGLVDDYSILAEQRLEEALVWVNFDPESVPAKCWMYFEERGLKHEWPVDLTDTTGVHQRQRDFGPGEVGIRWEW